MVHSSIIFEVTQCSADHCYDIGDRIVAEDIRLTPPEGKWLCTLLIPRLLDIIEKEELLNVNMEESEFTFSCKGDKKSCNGVLQLKVRDNQLGGKAAKKNMAKILKLISKVSFFKNFSSPELRSLFPLLTYKKKERGTIIIEKGSKPESVYIVLSGSVDVSDGESKLAVLGQGEIFGEMSLLGRNKAGATVTVRETAWIVEIAGTDFQKILVEYPKAQMFLVKVLSQRLAHTANNRGAELETVMSGQLAHLPPAELLQMLHGSQKSGTLALELPKGKADVLLWMGELIGARYGDLVNESAFYAILRESTGQFRFFPGEEADDRKNEVVGNFMGLLLEGLQRLDEESQRE